MQNENGLTAVSWPGIWLLVAMVVTVVGLIVCFAVGITTFGTYCLMTLLRGMVRCEDCGARFCLVEIKRDLTEEHRRLIP